MKSGFSLLELSIVLVIIGLLAGGVMTGQSLIRAAELRSTITEYQRFLTAMNGFRDKYQALAGDMKNATAFWGKDNTNCTSDSGTAATPGACNGNGDGIWTRGTMASKGEPWQLWKHLALAGLIEGTYTGIAGPSGVDDALFGTNAPPSKLSNAGWIANYSRDGWYDTYTFNLPLGNYFLYGAQKTGYEASNPVLKPEEAWNIDSKLDDGKPGRGRVVARFYNTCADATSYNDLNASYSLSNAGTICGLYFPYVQ